MKIRCDACSDIADEMITYNYVDYRSDILERKTPLCPKCEKPLRPHIMFFDEAYTERYHNFETINKLSAECDILIVVGTALQTGLARRTV